MIKTDAIGTAEWTKTFVDRYASSILQTNDGGYIISGRKNNSACEGGTDSTVGGACLVKTDPIGAIEWTKTYGGCSTSCGSVQQTSDGGYICVGGIGSGPPDIYLIKTDPAGAAEWTKTFGGPRIDEGCSIRQTSDGGYIITGRMSNNKVLGTCLIKTDKNGNVE